MTNKWRLRPMNQKHQPVATSAAQVLFVIVTFVTGVETPQTQKIQDFLEKYKTARERCILVWCSTKNIKKSWRNGQSGSSGFSYSYFGSNQPPKGKGTNKEKKNYERLDRVTRKKKEENALIFNSLSKSS